MGNWGKTATPTNPNGTNYATGTATQAPPDYVTNAYKNLISRAQTTGSTGYTPYSGGFSPDQTTAFQAIGDMRGTGTQQFGAANDALGRSMTPTYGVVGKYMNPFISNVVNATMANMQENNAQQQQGVVGNAISKGAYGGNRVGVAQAELARQQNLANQQTIAGLYQSGYDNALGAAQADKNAALQSAAGYGSLGSTMMDTGLQQTAAQLGAGTQQQQFNYSQYLNQQAFPYAQQSWLSSILGGIGPAAGGTTAQTLPDGNVWSQVLGLGTAALGALSDRRAKENVKPIGKTFDGQHIYSFRYKGQPDTHIGLMAQEVERRNPEAVNDNQQTGLKHVDYAQATAGAANKGHFASGGVIPYGGSEVPYVNDNESFPMYVPAVALAGGSGAFPTVDDWRQKDTTGRASGGVVPRGYAGGGWAQSFLRPDPPIAESIASPFLDDRGEVVETVPHETSGVVVPFSSPDTAVDPAGVVDPFAFAPAAAQDLSGGVASSIPLTPAYESPGVMSGPQFTTTPAPGYSQNLGEAFQSLSQGNGLNLSPDVNQSLIAAGGAMMASGRPFALSAVGEGIGKGVETWKDRQALERENALARSNIAYSQGSLAQAGQRLWIDAQKTAADIGLTAAQTGLTGAQTGAVTWEATPTPIGFIIRDTGSGQPGKVYKWGDMLPNGEIASPGQTPSGMTTPGGGDGTSPIFQTAAPPMTNDTLDPRLMNGTTAGIAVQEASNAIQDARGQQQTASSTNQMLQEMQHNLDTLPDNGLLAQGSGFGSRSDFAKGVNTMASVIGLGPIFPLDEVAATEDLNKLTTRLGQDLNKGFGSDNAASVVMTAIGAVPGGANSKEGAQRIIAGLQAMNQRKIDYYNFIQKWSASHSGSILGADEYFNRINPPELYALGSYVPEGAMQYLRAHPDQAGLFNAKYGNGRNVAQYVLTQ